MILLIYTFNIILSCNVVVFELSEEGCDSGIDVYGVYSYFKNVLKLISHV